MSSMVVIEALANHLLNYSKTKLPSCDCSLVDYDVMVILSILKPKQITAALCIGFNVRGSMISTHANCEVIKIQWEDPDLVQKLKGFIDNVCESDGL